MLRWSVDNTVFFKSCTIMHCKCSTVSISAHICHFYSNYHDSYYYFPNKSFIPPSYLLLFWGDIEGEKVEEPLKLGLGHTPCPVAVGAEGKKQQKKGLITIFSLTLAGYNFFFPDAVVMHLHVVVPCGNRRLFCRVF